MTLRELRHERGMTLRTVAHSAPVALGYLSEVERGEKEISSELLEMVAEAMNVSMQEILTRTAWQFEPQGIPTPEEIRAMEEAAELELDKRYARV